MQELTFHVPETVSARYLVPAPRAASVPDLAGLTEPLGELVADVLDRGLCTVSAHPAEETPPLPELNALPAHAAELGRAPWQLLVGATYPPGWPPVHEWSARAVSMLLARQYSGLLLDFTGPELFGCELAEASLPTDQMGFPLIRWMSVGWYAGQRAQGLRTNGLTRFGLPELVSEPVSQELVRPWGQVLNGLAWRFCVAAFAELSAHRGQRTATVPAVFELSSADPRSARGEQVAGDSGPGVPLRLAHDSEGLLRVCTEGADPSWICQTLGTA